MSLDRAEQQGVSPATAGETPAPDFNAIRDAVVDSFRAVPLWQFRQGLVAAGLIPADVQIQAADRKPVYGEPGVDMQWDEDVEAMRVDGIGWDLSFGCKVSFAYDHAKGEHYVCVSTSDADQRAGITSRRTTKEQLASLGQQLINVFGEPDPRDAEIKQLRYDLGESQNDVRRCGREIERLRDQISVANTDRLAEEQRQFTAYAELLNPIREVLGKSPVGASNYRELRDGINRLIGTLKREREADDAVTAEVTRLKRLVGDENVPYDGWDGLSRQDAIVRCEEGWQEHLKVRDELANIRHQLAIELNLKPSELADRETADLAVELGDRRSKSVAYWKDLAETWQARYNGLVGDALAVQQHLQRAHGKPSHPSEEFDKDYSRSMVDGLAAERDRLRHELTNAEADRDIAQANERDLRRRLARIAQETSFESALDEPRRWAVGDSEPEIGTTVTFGVGVSLWKRHDDGWKTASCSCKQCSSRVGVAWEDLLAYAPLVEVVSTDV